MQVCKWGNSLAVRLPKEVVIAAGLKEGDEVEIEVGEDRVFNIYKQVERNEALKRLFEACDRNPMVPGDYVFDRDEANER